MNKTAKWTMAALVGGVAVTAIAVLPATAQGRRMRRFDRPAQPRIAPTASWSEIDRTPRFNTNSRPGYYVWRQGDEVFVVSNDANRTRATHYSGDITVRGGSVSDVRGYETENHDHFRQTGKNRLTFSFETNNALDGVKFHVDGGKEIVMHLRGGVDDIYLGEDKIPTRRDPLVIAK